MPTVNGIDGEKVRADLARLQRLNERLANTRADVKAVYDDAEKRGIDRRALKRLFEESKLSQAEREHRDFLDAILQRSIGMEQMEFPFDEAAQSFAAPASMAGDGAETARPEGTSDAEWAAAAPKKRGGRPKGSKNKKAKKRKPQKGAEAVEAAEAANESAADQGEDRQAAE